MTAQTGKPADHASIKAYPEAVIAATDKATGVTVAVEADGVTVSARDASGKVLWSANVIAATGAPSVGDAVVRHVEIGAGGAAVLTVGKHRVVEADLRGGKLTFRGEN